jgi:UDP-N-acetyl-D-galactosamine dehydrogenase
LGEGGIRELGTANVVLFDVKSILPIGASDGRL